MEKNQSVDGFGYSWQGFLISEKKKTEHTPKGKKEKKNYLIKHPKKEK